jgi:hypothetical protein
MVETIYSAMAQRRRLRGVYNGGPRLLEPHVFGVSRSGHPLLRVFQVSGHSASSVAVGWKLLRVEDLTDLAVTEERFAEPRPEYNPDDAAMATIHCRIERVTP